MTFIPDCLWTLLFIEGLNTFYVANIKSVITYACPAWYNLLSDNDKTRLERIQRSATRIMLPFSDDYEQRLDNLALPTISTFLHTSCSEHFTKIANDDNHPLNSRIKINTNRSSARRAKIDRYRRSKCRTTERQNTFFLILHAIFSTDTSSDPFYFSISKTYINVMSIYL